jgi:hypothetical protein
MAVNRGLESRKGLSGFTESEKEAVAKGGRASAVVAGLLNWCPDDHRTTGSTLNCSNCPSGVVKTEAETVPCAQRMMYLR